MYYYKPQISLKAYSLFNVDSKDELEELITQTIHESTEYDAEEAEQKREEAKQKKKEAKKRKEAQQAAINDAAKSILALQPCVKCSQTTDEIKSLKEMLREKEEQVRELEAKNSDLQSSVAAKRSRIMDLEDQLQRKKACITSDSNE